MNNYYETQINQLKMQLNEEINKNQILMNENNNLRNIINNLNIQINQKDMIIQNHRCNFNNQFNNQMNNQFNNQFNNHLNNTITSIRPGEKIMTINFVSMGIQDITNYSIPCKNTDLFVRLEEKLNNDFPILKDHETYFEVIPTQRIKRFKTLDENNIKSNAVVNVFIADV